jgi:hypothetical protein
MAMLQEMSELASCGTDVPGRLQHNASLSNGNFTLTQATQNQEILGVPGGFEATVHFMIPVVDDRPRGMCCFFPDPLSAARPASRAGAMVRKRRNC